MFPQASVILFKGGCLYPSMYWGRHPLADTPLWKDTSPWQTPPYPQWPLQWTVCTLMECILVTGCNEVVAKVIFLHVCHSFCSQGGGESASVDAGMPPPGPGSPPRSRPPRADTTPPPRTRHHPPGPGRTPPDQTPPPHPPRLCRTPPEQTPPQTRQTPRSKHHPPPPPPLDWPLTKTNAGKIVSYDICKNLFPCF